MLSKVMLEQVRRFNQKPTLFERGTGNIWTEAYLASQMLQAHLNPEFDAASRKGKIINKTVDFLNEQFKKESTILDLGCGPGLYAEKLSMSGHKVTGVDFSKNTIDYAKNSARKQGLDIEYICDNLFNLEYIECYDAVVQIYGELNTFSDEERDRLFMLVKRALKPGGLFVFEVSTPIHRVKSRLKKNWSINEGGFWRGSHHIVLEEGFAYDDNIWLDQYIVIDENEVKVYRNWYHDYTKEAIEDIVLKNGFSQVRVIENLLEEEMDGKGEWLTVIAQK